MTRKRDRDIQGIFEAIDEAANSSSIEEANRAMSKRVRDYNARPQAELGGLSPDKMIQLLNGDWITDGALRLNSRLTLDDLAGAPILADARVLLEFVQAEEPVKETAAGFLPRATVAALRPLLRMPRVSHIFRNVLLTTSTNEREVPWLPDLRHALIFGKLLVRKKGLRITPVGRDLRSADRAGELYVHIFRTVFRVLDLGALDNSDDHKGLQATLGYSFYKLESATQKWRSPQALAQLAWLESAMDPPRQRDLEYTDLRYYTFKHRVLDPLVQFGLLDIRAAPGEDPRLREVEYRRTALFGRFLRFEFQRH
jgi:hypothetical protein